MKLILKNAKNIGLLLIGVALGCLVDSKWNVMQKYHQILPQQFQIPEPISSPSTYRQDLRILCYVLTYKDNLYKKAIHVKNTWAKKCNVTLFITGEGYTDPDFPSLGINTKSGRKGLSNKTLEAFDYIYQKHYGDADWFLKADDDTYIIMENLRYFLRDKITTEPLQYGNKFQMFIPHGYPSGGGGYVLSKEALRRYGTREKGQKGCQESNLGEDRILATCLNELGVVMQDSIDNENKSLFHALPAQVVMNKRYPKWYFTFDKFGGKLNISSRAISFHYVTPDQMHLLDFIIHKISTS